MSRLCPEDELRGCALCGAELDAGDRLIWRPELADEVGECCADVEVEVGS